MENLQAHLEYKFTDISILKQAMTHNSLVSDIHKNYQRLEFLGDRVLGLCVATMLYETFPDDLEGDLSQRFMGLVCKETVAIVALRLGLDKHSIVANDEIKTNENVLCDLCEAVIASIYLDGGYDSAFKFVSKYWTDLIDKNLEPPKDAKTSLQELLHVHNFGVPTYLLEKREGTEHEPIFYMSVCVQGFENQIGSGKSKKLAEQESAKKMIAKIGEKNGE